MRTKERIHDLLDDYTLSEEHPEVVEARSVQNCNRYTIEVKHTVPLNILSKLDADEDLEFRCYPTQRWDGEGKIRLVIRPK